jgi:quercetin dioxygenase-like cupin family protein
MSKSPILLAPTLGRKTLNNTYRYPGGNLTILLDASETAGAFALVESAQIPGGEPPLHKHEREDELFYVMEGKVSFWSGGVVRHLEAGESIFLPRQVPHAFRVKSKVARCLTYIAPAGFEDWFRMLGKPAESFVLPDNAEPPNAEMRRRAEVLAPTFGIQLLGPAPEF